MRRKAEIERAYEHACRRVYDYRFGDSQTSHWIGVRDTLAWVLFPQPNKALGIGSSVLWFAAAMDAELRANTHKHGWGTMKPHQLLHRLRQETEELADAIARGNPEEIVSEAADVANFAMMIADVSTPQPWDDE